MNLSPLVSAIALGLAVAALAACSGRSEVAAPASAPASAASAATKAAPPVTVTTVQARQQDLPVVLSTTGTVTPLNSVEVRAQVSSVVSQVHVRDGQFVKAGELLFTLDARADVANVAKAQAQLARDQAALADAQRQYQRSQQLLAQNFISQGALDTSLSQVEAQTALVAADQAAVDAARVALSYARVTAPGAGRVGVVNVSVGSAVQANVTPLVTVTQLDPIAVAFSLPQRNLGDALEALQGGGAVVQAALPDGAGSASGRLKFVDNVVDANSGTVKVKAVFDNRNHALWPGAFVEVTQTVKTLKDAVVIPQAAIIQGARGTVVYLVEGGKAVQKPVQLLYAQGADAAVSGIPAGAVVVLDGRQNVRPGGAVVERAKP